MDNTPTWGGRRKGAGRPIVHTDPTIKERTKKLRATDQEWERFIISLPPDTRQAFLMLKTLVAEDYMGRITISAK